MAKRNTSPQAGSRNSPADDESRQADNGQHTQNALHTVFLDEVADVYNAEQQLLKALPKMAKAAQSEELREAFESHLEETEDHARRIEEAMSGLQETLQRKTCKAMQGLIAEADEMIKEFAGEASIDAVLIAAAQKVEHYEIASYGTLVAWANRMGHTEAADLFQETLDEERWADETLTDIAENLANEEAVEND